MVKVILERGFYNMNIAKVIAEELGVRVGQVEAAVKLIDEGLSLIHI